MQTVYDGRYNMATIIAEKILEDGSLLKIRMWVSDAVMPGQKMYQLGILSCTDNGHRHERNWPVNFEDYTEAQIRDIYNRIESEKQFKEMGYTKQSPAGS